MIYHKKGLSLQWKIYFFTVILSVYPVLWRGRLSVSSFFHFALSSWIDIFLFEFADFHVIHYDTQPPRFRPAFAPLTGYIEIEYHIHTADVLRCHSFLHVRTIAAVSLAFCRRHRVRMVLTCFFTSHVTKKRLPPYTLHIYLVFALRLPNLIVIILH